VTSLGRLTAALADRNRLDRDLGTGGMATVYLAHDLRHEHDVAIGGRHRDSVFSARLTLGPRPTGAPRITAPTLLFTGPYQGFGGEPACDAAP
jgi:hypothetical protein